MDITLDDLLILEPRLVRNSAASILVGAPWRGNAVEVTWAVSARTMPPHLPLLRGGELLLVPRRVVTALAPAQAALLAEAKARGVSAVVFEGEDFDTTYPGSGGAVLLRWHDSMTEDTEAGINRLLTAYRGTLYRVGSELERRLTDLAMNGAGLAALVRATSEASGLPLAVQDAQGRELAASSRAGANTDSGDPKPVNVRLQRELPFGATLVFGPLTDTERVTARFLGDRIVAAASAALQRDDAARPRGQHRAEATMALLTAPTGSTSDQRAAALALGLDPDAVFYVAVSQGASDPAVTRALSSLGSAHPTGPRTGDGQRLTLVAATGRAEPNGLANRVAEVKRQWEVAHAKNQATLALSAATRGVAGLPGAAREAQFVAALQAQGQSPRLAASFESVTDIGALRLLYPLRDSSELRQFVSEALGAIENRDRRGTLRATLRAFLESGGSHVDASSRLGIHRNTLSYRLRRIGELIGGDVADPTRWLTLHLALCASDMLKVCEDDD